MRFAGPENLTRSYVSETPITSLTGPTSDHEGVGASVTLSEYQGPLVDWWAAADGAVAHCWSETPLSLTRQRQLTTYSVEKPFVAEAEPG